MAMAAVDEVVVAVAVEVAEEDVGVAVDVDVDPPAVVVVAVVVDRPTCIAIRVHCQLPTGVKESSVVVLLVQTAMAVVAERVSEWPVNG